MVLDYPKSEPFNFLGLESQSYSQAKIVILPVPYSSTCYWKTNTNQGPQAIIDASRHIELYDLETKKDPSKEGIFTLDPLEPSKNSPKETINRIEKVITQIISDKKFPLVLGGEHSITLGPVLALVKKFKNLSVLYFDAHLDLRDSFEGTKYSHACVARRILDLNIPIVWLGIRSLAKEEAKYIKKKKIKSIFYAPHLPQDRIISGLTKNVYLTIDLDVLDPSIMPSVGTPEPEGLFLGQVLSLIKKLAKRKNIIGFDLVELSPLPGLLAPDFLAAKLVYKIISYL